MSKTYLKADHFNGAGSHATAVPQIAVDVDPKAVGRFFCFADAPFVSINEPARALTRTTSPMTVRRDRAGSGCRAKRRHERSIGRRAISGRAINRGHHSYAMVFAPS